MTSHQASDRRKFLKGGLAAAGAVTLAPALLATPTIAEERGEGGAISPDDIAIFKFRSRKPTLYSSWGIAPTSTTARKIASTPKSSS